MKKRRKDDAFIVEKIKSNDDTKINNNNAKIFLLYNL